jgi:hypothetical protein
VGVEGGGGREDGGTRGRDLAGSGGCSGSDHPRWLAMRTVRPKLMSCETSAKADSTAWTNHQVGSYKIRGGEVLALVLFPEVVQQVTVVGFAQVASASSTPSPACSSHAGWTYGRLCRSSECQKILLAWK